MTRALPGGVRCAATVAVAVAGGSITVRRAAAKTVSVPKSEDNLAWEQRDYKTYKSNDDLFHDVFYLLNFTRAVWMACLSPGDWPRERIPDVDEQRAWGSRWPPSTTQRYPPESLRQAANRTVSSYGGVAPGRRDKSHEATGAAYLQPRSRSARTLPCRHMPACPLSFGRPHGTGRCSRRASILPPCPCKDRRQSSR